jgi:threonine dehydrogenase-like Zn-dependent dehydrogenase
VETLVYRGPWELTVETREDPRPGPGDVLVRVVATGICGSDVHGFTGENGRRHPGQVMGHETVGKVEKVGDDVDPGLGLRPGTVVTVNPVLACGDCPACTAGSQQSCPQRRVIGVTPDIVSAFAGLMVLPARNAVVLPAEMPIEYGALVEPLSVGFHAARRGGCTAEDAVLVVGGGPIGQACVLAARRLGVERIAVTEPDARRRGLAGSLGAVGVDPTASDPVASVTHVLGRPATLVLDAVGSTASLADAMACSGFGARVVLVGMSSPRIELAAYAVSTEERTLVGSFTYSAQDFRDTADWVATAPAVLGRLVEGRVDMLGAAAAFTELANGTSSASKVLVYPHGVPADTGRLGGVGRTQPGRER